MVSCTSEDPGYPADELNVHSPNTRGWQSAKFSEYPQEIGLALDGGDARFTQVQILSHQSKIASKIEIFIGSGSSYQSAQFKRLGYLSLDSNERSQYQARELKTVYIDYSGAYVRLVIHRNYVNKQNLFNQAGIVAVNLLGTSQSGPSGARGLDASGGNIIVDGGNPLNDLSVDMNLDPQTASKLRLLSETKSRAIATEDYLTAKQIKAVEGELKALGSRLAQLDMAKRQAVGAEDYDRAKEIKDETDELRGDIERKILEIHIPGVTDTYRGREVAHQHALPDEESRIIHPPAVSTPPKPKFAPGPSGEGKDDDGGENPFRNLEDTSPQAVVHRSGADMKGVPLNIDDIPVGKPQMAANDAQKKKYSESDPVPYSQRGIASAPEEYLPNGDRPIRPKKDADADYDDEAAFPDRFKEEEAFPDGQHPLEGVPNSSDLPVPDDLIGKSKDVADQNGVTSLCGEYVTRCLFSKNWQLREAAITKIHMRLQEEYENEPGITSCIPALSTIVRIGVEDKIEKVLLNAVALLDDMLAASRRAKVGRSTIAPALDPATANLVEKLSDSKERIRESARKGMEILASSANIGPAVVGAHALRPLNAKQKAAWRPIVARLQILTELINQYGLGSSSGIMAPAVMKFAQDNGCFTHSNGEVRDATKDLTVAVQKHTGTQAIEPYLKGLRPKQLEEYEYAFDGGTGAMTRKAAQSKSSLPKFDGPTSPRSAGAKAQAKGHASPHKKGQDKDDEALDFTTCMFCGMRDPTWNEDALDLHYWKDCALLAPCPACAQVVEVAGMADHLLDECEHKEEYTTCATTGLAVEKTKLGEWNASPQCKPCPTGTMYCPLCLGVVEDTDDAWRNHLFQNCPKNTRCPKAK